jgi:hypothetical protein
MELTRVEKERILDSQLKIQAVADSLKHVGPGKVENIEGIQECLDDAEKHLGAALRLSTAT